MRVLVACEASGAIRRQFRHRGHEAYSCDIKAAEDGSQFHIRGNALWYLRDGWDALIGNPECRYLCNSGVLRLYMGGKKVNGKDLDRWAKMEAAARFYSDLADAPVGRICLENSVMHGYAKEIIAPHVQGWETQIIQPHQFGHDASKATRLQLKNLAPLRPTLDIAPRMVDGKPRWANQTDSGQNKLAPSPTRSADRARTYAGIAKAMAEQWGTVSGKDK